LLDHGLEDLVVGFAFVDVGIEVLLHAASGFTGPGECAARVIAEAGGILAAAAHAEDTFS
jgi:hypothetical protein